MKNTVNGFTIQVDTRSRILRGTKCSIMVFSDMTGSPAERGGVLTSLVRRLLSFWTPVSGRGGLRLLVTSW